MKRAPIIAGLTLLLLLLPWTLRAQPRRHWSAKHSSMLFGGVSLEGLDLSSEQLAIAREIKQAYDDQMPVLEAKLMSKRLELQSLFRNPQMHEDVIRAKAREVMDLENQCQNLAIDYQIRIRGMLSAEQLRNWCTSSEWCPPHKRRR